MDLLTAKVIAMLTIGFVSLGIGCIPIGLSKVFQLGSRFRKTNNCTYDKLVSLLLCFGGGVLFFTTFLHLQPEIRATFQQLEASGRIQPINEYFGLQLSEIVICCGFFCVYAIEEIVHFLLDRTRNVHTDGDDEVVAIHRTLSLRRCQDAIINDGDASPKFLSISMDFNNVIVDGRKLNDDSLPAECPHEVSLFDHPVDNTALYNRTQHDEGGPGGSCQVILNGRHHQHHSHQVLQQQNGSRRFFQSTGQSTASLITNTTAENGSREIINDQPTCRMSRFDGPDTVKGMMRGLIAVLALSIHAIFEGLAVGLEESVSSVWYMFLAIATHKFVIIFCVGMELVSTRIRSFYIFIYVFAFSIVTPLGILAGTLLCSTVNSNDEDLLTHQYTGHGTVDEATASEFAVIGAVLQAMAAGTLLYVIFFEVLVRDRSHQHHQQPQHHHDDSQDESGFYQLFAIICGFLFMFVLHLLTKCE